jgi:predicted lipid-binding transport protein (Tim44 family)
MSVHAAREANDPAAARDNDLFPDIAKSLRAEIAGRAAQGVTVEFRNLCIRKVELILVRNYSDNSRDEFTARISAHAQQVVESGGHETAADPHVVPFEEYWTFGRLDKTWKLKEVVPKAQGDQELNAENLDEDSTPAQVQWYYRQTRAN